jgi:TDG/mug DNA glycosylase family protein
VQASEVALQELRSAAVSRCENWEYQPQALAVLGTPGSAQASAARSGNRHDHRDDQVWVLPNPSGLNRATLDKLVAAYRELDDALATRGQ